jgi:3-hydroxyisobutyrate dehydrogenase-like beta-hydroxyacid dehydrogenase
MAKNLLRAGHALVFYGRRAEVVDEFTALGAQRAASPAEVMQAADIVITIVTADPQLEEVVLAPHGLLAGASPGKLLVDMSTVSPATERDLGRQLHAAGVALLDAPVSGGPWGAESATLAIMVGGEVADVQRARPAFEAIGKHIFHVGPLGAGQTVKLVNQLVAGGIMALVGEGFVTAKAAGVDLNALADVMAVSSGNSAVFEARGKKFLLANQFVPGFMTELMHKDVALAVEMASRLGVPTPVAAEALAQYQAAIRLGHGRDDFAAVAKVCEQAAGVRIVDG